MAELPKRILFMGTPEFARVSLEALLAAGGKPVAVFTQPDKPAGRKRVLQTPPVKALAAAHGIEVLQARTLKDPEVISRIRGLSPDVIAVVAYGKILPKPVLDVPRLGCVNVHASLLPRHRGAAPIAHAIWAGDESTGVCTMRMEEGLDTGPVYRARAIPIPPDATTGTLTPVLAALGAELLVETLEELQSGSLQAVPQDGSRATLAPRIRSEEGRLDFSRAAALLERQVRAFDPWPGTHIEVRGERVNVLSSALGPAAPPASAPGEVIAGPGLGVACGDGCVLYLARIQREGRKAMPSAEVLRGFPIPPGTRLQG
jgi:methionyl-tRNA formyltransferase